MVTSAETQTRKPLLGHQQTMASRVLVETVGELANQGLTGDDLKDRATSLATALEYGLSQLNSKTCNAE